MRIVLFNSQWVLNNLRKGEDYMKRKYFFILSLMLCFSLLNSAVSSAHLADSKEITAIEGVVKNHFNSFSLTETSIDYDIVGITKINNYHYEVKVAKEINGVEYPVIPYDVVLENGQWKFDNSSIVVYPKDKLEQLFQKISDAGLAVNLDVFYSNVVSENENFIVKKFGNDRNIGIMAELEYNFGEKSTDIWNSGTITVYTDPGENNEPDDEYNWVIVELYDEDPLDSQLVDFEAVDAFDNDSASFDWPGYVGFKVYNFNYPWLPGKYTVVY